MNSKRYGISMGISPREPLERMRTLAPKIESHGFEALWIIDFQLGMKDVYAGMAMAAIATEKLQIGPGVTNLVTRHPTVTANAMTAIDELSNGRAILGLGTGYSANYGAGRPPSPINEVREGMAFIRKLWTGEVVEQAGGEINLATARRQIPIYLAVSQPRILKLSGEQAEGAILMGAADPGVCEWQLQYIYEGLKAAGRQRSDMVIDLVVTMSVNDDEDAALADVRAWATSQAWTFNAWKHFPPAFERFRGEFAQAASAYHLVDHLSLHAAHKAVVSDEFVKTVAVVGNKEHCIARVRELAALDIDRITFALLSGGRERRLSVLADDILSRV